MKVTFVGHASILVEAGGLNILSDPWWAGSCFGTQWWPYPKPAVDAVDPERLDYIYISHGHADHLHNGTLSRLPKTAVCLVAQELNLSEPLKGLGFEVIEVAPKTDYALNEKVTIEITPTVSGDSFSVIRDDRQICMNMNDALHAAPRDVQTQMIGYLNAKYGQADYMFCGFGIASHFPICIEVPGRDRDRTAAERQKHFNREWAYIVHGLGPKYAFPFAADVIFLDENIRWANSAVHNGERPVDVLTGPFATPQTKAIDIYPGFSIEGDNIVVDARHRPVVAAEIDAAFESETRMANRSTAVTADGVEDLVVRLRENLETCRQYLCEIDNNYRFLIEFIGNDAGIEICKTGNRLDAFSIKIPDIDKTDYAVVFLTKYSYLRRSLSDEFGHEVLSVGSGGVFRYRSRAEADANLHGELMLVLRTHTAAPPSRFGDQSKLTYQMKTLVKKALRVALRRPAAVDLYDNRHWIRYEGHNG